MIEPTKNYSPNDTTDLFNDLNKILYILGLRNFWVDDVKLPKKFVKIFNTLYPVMYFFQVVFCLLQIGGLFTQKHLTSKQHTDAIVYNVCQPVIHLCCWNCISHRNRCRQVLYYLAVVLKDVYNDSEIEQSMIRKFKLFLVTYTLSIVLNWGYCGLQALIAVVMSGATFTAIITAWPDVTDTSIIAGCGRVLLYLLWSFSFYRMSTVFFIVLALYLSLSHQFKNLHKYFESLNNIFENNELCHNEKEIKFKAALVKGIHAHYNTLWCVAESKKICNGTNSVIVFLGPPIIPFILNIRNNDEFYSNMVMFLVTIIVMGLFMWNAGDITAEAQKLPEAIFSCGWYNCYGKQSARIRSLVVVAMMQAQRPVVFTGFGVVEMSYETFVAIIKTAYSMVSVFY